MDLAFGERERALADEAREWLRVNYEAPPAFATFDEEVEWGRAWQAKLAGARWVGISWPGQSGGPAASAAGGGRGSTAAALRPRSRWPWSTSSTRGPGRRSRSTASVSTSRRRRCLRMAVTS